MSELGVYVTEILKLSTAPEGMVDDTDDGSESRLFIYVLLLVE